MIDLLKFFAARTIVANIFTLGVITLGIGILTTLSFSEYPNIALGETRVTTIYPGASPEDVEVNVTNKLERELLTVFEIDTMRSVSSEGRSYIELELKTGADLEKANRRIRDAVQRVTDLPPEVTDAPHIFEQTSASFDFLTVGIAGGKSYSDLHTYIRQFEKKLRRIPGVGEIRFVGLRDREMRIELDPDRVAQYDLTLSDVVNAVRARSVALTGGTLESYVDEKNIVTLAELQTVEDTADVIVRPSANAPLIQLKDIGTVDRGFSRATETASINGHPVIALDVRKSEDGDVISTARAINTLIADERDRTGGAFQFHTGFDLSIDVWNRFSMVQTNGLIGLLLVMIVLGVVLSRRTAFWVAISIPVSIFGVVCFAPWFVGGLDSITLAALVLVIGIIVDDSVVVAEAIQSGMERGLAPLDAAAQGANRMLLPVVTGMLTTAIVFMPLFFLPGAVGAMTYVIPATVIIALTFSLIECFFALPAHIIGHGDSKKAGSESWFVSIQKVFYPVIRFVLRIRYLVVGVASVVLVFVGGIVLANTSFVFFQTDQGRVVEVEVEFEPGISVEAAQQRSVALEKIFLDLPAAEFVSYTATIRPPRAEYVLSFTHANERDRSINSIVDDLKGRSDELVGFEAILYEIDAGGPPVGRPIEMRIYGGEDSQRQRLIKDLITFLSAQAGVSDTRRDDPLGKRQVALQLDHAWLAREGVSVEQVARTIRTAYEGEEVSQSWFGDERIDFRVILKEEFRNLTSLPELTVRNSNGDLVPLNRFAQFVEQPGAAEIRHWNAERSTIISADLDFDAATPTDIAEAVEAWYDPLHYPGVTLSAGGQAEETDEALSGLGVALLASLVAVYFLLVILFNSVWQPLLVVSVIPFAILAVGVTLLLHNTPLSFTGAVGTIGLMGIVVNGVLVLVYHINDLHHQSKDLNMGDAIAQGTTDRLRPIMLTTLTTVAGMLPLAYGLGGIDVFMAPMAMSVGFGLLFSVPAILFVVPCLYGIGHDLLGDRFAPAHAGAQIGRADP